jgi:O-antigen/teichoic acid export membrane protein
MDASVSRTVLLRAWSVVAGLFTVLPVPVFLTPEEQGFYYSFSSLIAMQIFFELGLGQVLLFRFAAMHQQILIDKSLSFEDLVSLLFASRWLYRFLALLFFVFTLSVGYFFFGTIYSTNVSWRVPWFFLVFASSINLLQSVKLTYLEAVGDMAHVSVARLRTSFVSAIAFVVVLLSGGALWAACVIPSFNAALMTAWLFSHRNDSGYRKVRKNPVIPRADILFMWQKQIWPMQWRLSISWLSGYFIFQLFNPIALSNFGPLQSGRLGYTIAITSSLSVVASTFTSALSPKLAALYAAGKINEFNDVFRRSLIYSIPSLVLLLSVVPILICLLKSLGLSYASRLLPLGDSVLYSLTAFFSGLVFLLSVYLRSQQNEPLLKLSFVTSLVMIPALLLGSTHSITAMLSLSLIVIFMSFLWALRIFDSNRRKLLLAAVQ